MPPDAAADPVLDRLDVLLAPAGLFVRGGFHARSADGVPALPGGAEAGTVILVGNAGRAMWEAFAATADRSGRNPLDRWLRGHIAAAARATGAHVLFPNDGPPFVPVLDWAGRAEPIHRSPIGITIHPDYGLWHVYRAVLLFRDRLSLPPPAAPPSPCDSCAKKPCLSVCPADAFRPDRFDAAACAAHVESAAGTACRERGCLARRACPVGRDYLYGPEQQAFHTAAMLGAVRSGYGGGGEAGGGGSGV